MARPRPRPHAAALLAQHAPLPQAPAPQAGGGPQIQQAVNPYDFGADPILQSIMARGQARTAEAEANALAARKQLAIDFGDPSLAPDPETAAAAQANSFSKRALFEKAAREEPRQLTESLNNNNLFYSGAYGKAQSDLATNLLQRQQQMQQESRSRLGEIESGLQGARSQQQDDLIAAQQEAAARLQQRLGDNPVGYQGPQSAHALNVPAAMHNAFRPKQKARHLPRPGVPAGFRP